MFIDSHCHINFPELKEKMDDILSSMEERKITHALCVSVTLDKFPEIRDLAGQYKHIFASVGVHPDYEDIAEPTVDQLTLLSKDKNVVAIGETGLDFYYNNSDKDNQINSFKEHIEASIKTNSPLIIHSRDAEEETFNILNNYKDKNLKILMHCFTGSLNFAKKLLTLNAFFSASGIITFKNSLDLQETFNFLPLDKILIETDSPFLAPVPNRGKKNEPAFIDYTAQKLADIKNISKLELIDSTSNNFNKLFFN